MKKKSRKKKSRNKKSREKNQNWFKKLGKKEKKKMEEI